MPDLHDGGSDVNFRGPRIHLPVPLAGDQALFRWLSRRAIEAGRVDHAFIDAHTDGYAAYAASLLHDSGDFAADIGVSHGTS